MHNCRNNLFFGYGVLINVQKYASLYFYAVHNSILDRCYKSQKAYLCNRKILSYKYFARELSASAFEKARF